MISIRWINSGIPLIVFLVIFSGCKKKEKTASPQPTSLPVVTQTAPVPQEKKEKPVYVYSGDRFRDPFTPSGQTANYQPDAIFDPQRATLTGIIFGRDFKSAVINVGGSGTYFIKSGKIFDIMGKTIEGFTAKVFVDKILILGEADNVFELKFKSNEEEAKPS